MGASRPRRRIRPRHLVFAAGIVALGFVVVLLRFAVVTDYLYHAAVKDPVRVSPVEPSIVAPADGTVLYVRRFKDGQVPIVIKKNTPIPVESFLHMKGEGPRAGGMSPARRSRRTPPSPGCRRGSDR